MTTKDDAFVERFGRHDYLHVAGDEDICLDGHWSAQDLMDMGAFLLQHRDVAWHDELPDEVGDRAG